MLSRLFEENASSKQDAVIEPGRSTSWSELQEQTEFIAKAQKEAVAGLRVGLCFPPAARSYAALAALDRLTCDAFLFDARLTLKDALNLAKKLKLDRFLYPAGQGAQSLFDVHELPNEEKRSRTNTITILTSGSTGEPKAVCHSWASLIRPVRKRTLGNSPRWFLPYSPHLYAGMQVALQCFSDQGTLILPHHQMDVSATAQFMATTGVEFASATPSYWRRLLLFSPSESLSSVPLAQITVGGEAVDQPLLDNLQRHFPHARVVHIYATTELGRCFSVTDGLAGFPTSYLNRVLVDGVELKVSEGQLFVRSPNSMSMYDSQTIAAAMDSGYSATGDLVEVCGDRVYFVGRKSDMINVAGTKVHPVAVECVIRSIPGVSDVRAFGRASSIAGELVACEIVPASMHDTEVLRRDVIMLCRAQLASYQQPRFIKFVDHIQLSPSSKTIRRATS